MSTFLLRLFGTPILAAGEAGERVLPVGAKPLALLAYLVLERRPHSRESLAGLLWGESPEIEARASLRQALKQLRDVLGDQVHAERALVEVTGPVACDVLSFREAVERDSASAAGFAVPRFFEGASLRRAPQFEEWISSTRGELLRLYHQVLARLGREAMTQCHWREAMELADRWLLSEPVSDEAAHLAIEARYLSGNRAGALAKFAEYRDLLAREAGCEPDRSLQALVRRVEADRATSDAPPITDEWYTRAPTFEASLVGRDGQWKELTGAWKAALRGRGRIVLIDGETGVGKSRLADEFLRWVVAEGGTALSGRSYDRRAGTPYEPVVEVLRCALAAPGIAATAPEWLVEVARLVPELRDRFPALPFAGEPHATEGWRLFEGVAQLLVALAAERPVAIVVDDLQWCDEDTCNLIRFLTRRLEHSQVLWLGVVTPGEVERDAPASRLCRALRAKGHAEVLSVGALGEDEVWQLVREMGHVSVPNGGRRLAARLHRITAGNPFHLIELLKTMFAQGLLAMDEHSGEWIVVPSEVGSGREVPVSQSVQDVIAERVDRLSSELRDVLITIAVGGGACRPDVLSHVHGISRLHAAAVGDSLVDRRLVVEEAGRYRCIHPAIAHLMRDGLTASRRQEVHRSLALALELVTPQEEVASVAGEIARHAERGGEREHAYRYARLAADGAVSRYAYAEALAWLDLAATSAKGADQAQAVDQLTAEVMERAGWSEAPSHKAVPVTREIVSEDLDLRVRG